MSARLSKEQEELRRKDFLEYSGGFAPHEAADEVMLYLEHNVDGDDLEAVTAFFEEWAAAEASDEGVVWTGEAGGKARIRRTGPGDCLVEVLCKVLGKEPRWEAANDEEAARAYMAAFLETLDRVNGALDALRGTRVK